MNTQQLGIIREGICDLLKKRNIIKRDLEIFNQEDWASTHDNLQQQLIACEAAIKSLQKIVNSYGPIQRQPEKKKTAVRPFSEELELSFVAPMVLAVAGLMYFFVTYMF